MAAVLVVARRRLPRTQNRSPNQSQSLNLNLNLNQSPTLTAIPSIKVSW
ncbi:hypothetical protein [Marinimicrobium sp.]|nr:hypothetical protein [Marinimicrobium sp.]